MSYNIILRSTFWGQGKTVGALSYHPPDNPEPRRLVFDREYRDEGYQGEEDDHDRMLFAFQFFRDHYGDFDVANLTQLYYDIKVGDFPFDVLIFDNATMWQEEFFALMAEKQRAMQIAKEFDGVYDRNRLFLDYKFKPTDPGGYYTLLKSAIRALLLACRRAGVDVIVTCESKNVWQNYGTRNAKILGQTAKVWDPWFQFSDQILVLSRVKGSRELGTARLTACPTAQMDTFNVKSSIPGIAPEFVMCNWDIFWKMAERRTVPTQDDFDELEIERAASPEKEINTIEQAKMQILDVAERFGLIKGVNDKAGIKALKELGAEQGLSTDNALAELTDWVELLAATAEQGS